MDGNRQLGDFLRSRRTRLRPEDVGIVSLRRRRTPGLRREEVAQLAGISAEWYVKLEQGRAVSPSAATIEALGGALQLDKLEQAHLRSLVEIGGRKAFSRELLPPSLGRLVESLPQPAYITGQRWDILAWNDAAADLFGDFGSAPVEDRNILVFMLTDATARRLFGATWAQEARRMVSLFRVTHDLWAGDPAFSKLVVRLRANCSQFEGWWKAHDIAAPVSGTKTLHHPTRGILRFDYATFQANDDPALKLAIYLSH